jgi:hypothetical protein
MKVARFARNVVLVALAFRLIVRRRHALARERRARRIAPLLIAAGGTGVILAVRPRILEDARRLWDVARPQLNRNTSVSPSGEARLGRSQKEDQQPRALVETEPKPGVKKRPKRVSRSAQSKKGRRKSEYGVKAEGEERSERATEAVESPKH